MPCCRSKSWKDDWRKIATTGAIRLPVMASSARGIHTKRGEIVGGHSGHQGHALQQAAMPDQGITHRPTRCEVSSASLAEVTGQVEERRQIHELSVLRLVVPEHQGEMIACPACGHLSIGNFPARVDAPAQYGPRMQALAVSLSPFQFLPLARMGELVADLWDCP